MTVTPLKPQTDALRQAARQQNWVAALTLAAIRTALEAAGVEFTNGDAPGVKLRKVEG